MTALADRIDPRAKQILFAKVDAAMRWQPLPSTADLAYAKSKRMLFAPLTATHGQIVERIVVARESLTLATVSGAFLASLSSGRLDLRSGLASYACSETTARHEFVKWCEADACEICHLPAKVQKRDRDFHSFQRHGAAGFGLHFDALYQMLDLEELAREAPLAPTKEDLVRMRVTLHAAATTPAADGAAKLNARLKPTLGGSKHERTMVIDGLAACGVLGGETVGSESAEFSGSWRGKDGVNAKRVREVFGMHGVTMPRR